MRASTAPAIRPRGPGRHEATVLRALLWTLTPGMVLVWLRYHGLPAASWGALRLPDLGWLTATLLVAWGGSALPERSQVGRALATVGVVLGAGLLVGDLWRRPDAAYVLLAFAAVLLVRIWPRDRRDVPMPAGSARIGAAHDARASALVAAVAWAVAVPAEWTARRASAGALAGVIGVAACFTLRWAWEERRAGSGRGWVALVGVVIAASGAALQWRISPLAATVPLVVGPLSTFAAVGARPRADAGAWASAVVERPARLLAVSVVGLSLWGAAVLGLPFCASSGRPVAWIDAWFTAVSAVTGTGLMVLPADAYSGLGHAVLAVLAELGALVAVGFGAAWLERPLVEGAPPDGTAFPDAARRAVSLSIWMQLLGAGALAYLFRMSGDSLPGALARGTFLAISAFCNAGLVLSESAGWSENGLVLAVVGTLAWLGNLGPSLIWATVAWARTGRASVGVRISVWAAAALTAIPSLLFLFFEAGHTGSGLGALDQVGRALFLAIDARSAGFGVIPIPNVHPATLALLFGLVFVGGSPASAAGGVKTTAVALLGLAVGSSLRGDAAPSAFGRRFPARTVYRAASLVTLGFLAVGGALVALLATQTLAFEVALLEVVSALGNAGLTLGAGRQIDGVGKIVLGGCMWLGRVGPLGGSLLLAGARRRDTVAALPEQDVPIG
jgi:trk system potassium uptake protein TrkH